MVKPAPLTATEGLTSSANIKRAGLYHIEGPPRVDAVTAPPIRLA